MSTERQGIVFNRFGGLRLDLPLDEVGPEQAIALLDVDWLTRNPGLLRSRPGADPLDNISPFGIYRGLWRHSSGLLVAQRSEASGENVLVGVGSSGAELVVSPFGLSAASAMDYFNFGTPTDAFTYACRENAVPKRLDSSPIEVTEPKATVDGVAGKAMPKIKFADVWPEAGNRVIAATGEVKESGPGGAQSSLSHIWASDPGSAESWHTVAPEANFVQLLPGDGEQITGVRRWNGMMFVAKETRVFVFYSVGVDSEGAPIFNFRVIDLGTSMVKPDRPGSTQFALPVMAAGEDGMYLLTQSGVLLTTGGTPVVVSSAVPVFSSSESISGPMAALLGGVDDWMDFRGMLYMDRRLFVASGSRMLVYDVDLDAWLLWSTSMAGMAPWEANTGGGRRRLFFAGNGVKAICGYDDELTTDLSAEPQPSWQSGFYDLGSEDEKELVSARLWGSGNVTLASFKNLAEKAGFSVEKAIGATGGKLFNNAQTGSLFSHRLELEPGAEVQRVVRYLRVTRTSSTRTGAP